MKEACSNAFECVRMSCQYIDTIKTVEEMVASVLVKEVMDGVAGERKKQS